MLLYYSVIVVTVLYCSIIFVSFEAREIMKMPFSMKVHRVPGSPCFTDVASWSNCDSSTCEKEDGYRLVAEFVYIR